MSMLFIIIGSIITIIMGFGFGSFATMATYRIPRNMPWIGDKPRCFSCKAELNIIDYFSIFSLFLHKGKCRYCKKSYECSISYFITEFSITALLLLNFFQYHFDDQFVLVTGAIVGGVIMAVVDAENKRIPAKILISMLLMGAIYRTYIDKSFYGLIYGCIAGAIIGLSIRYLYFYLIGKKEIASDFTKWQHNDRFIGEGFDYVKLLAIIGGWLPFHNFIILSIVCGIIILTWNFIHKQSLRIGTILTCGLIFSVLYPTNITNIINMS